MAELNVPDLCGGSAEFNAIQIKFDALIKSGLDGLELDASALSVTIGNDAISLVTELRKAVSAKPALPNVNLQSQLTNLTRLPAGSAAHKLLLAAIKLKFGDGLTAGGFSLDALVSKAATQIKLGLDLCTEIPNFEVPADGGVAVEKSIESKQSTKDSEEEKPSTVVKNTNLTATQTDNETRVANMQVETSTAADVVSGTVTSTTPPTKDKGAFTVTEKKKEVAYKEIKTEVTTPADQEGKNVTTSGFSKQPIFVHEEFKTGSPIVLKHKPSKIILVRAYTTQYRNGIFAVEIFPPSGPAGGSQHFGYGKRDSYTINEKTLTIEEKFFTYDGKPRAPNKGLRFKVAYEYLGNYDPSWRVK